VKSTDNQKHQLQQNCDRAQRIGFLHRITMTLSCWQ